MFVLPHPASLSSLFEASHTCDQVREALRYLADFEPRNLGAAKCAAARALHVLDRVRPTDLIASGMELKARFAAYDNHFGVERSGSTWWAVSWSVATSLADSVVEVEAGTCLAADDIYRLLAGYRSYASRLLDAARS